MVTGIINTTKNLFFSGMTILAKAMRATVIEDEETYCFGKLGCIEPIIPDSLRITRFPTIQLPYSLDFPLDAEAFRTIAQRDFAVVIYVAEKMLKVSGTNNGQISSLLELFCHIISQLDKVARKSQWVGHDGFPPGLIRHMVVPISEEYKKMPMETLIEKLKSLAFIYEGQDGRNDYYLIKENIRPCLDLFFNKPGEIERMVKQSEHKSIMITDLWEVDGYDMTAYFYNNHLELDPVATYEGAPQYSEMRNQLDEQMNFRPQQPITINTDSTTTTTATVVRPPTPATVGSSPLPTTSPSPFRTLSREEEEMNDLFGPSDSEVEEPPRKKNRTEKPAPKQTQSGIRIKLETDHEESYYA